MSSLANSVLKLQAYDLDGTCPIRVESSGSSMARRPSANTGASALAIQPWVGEDLGAATGGDACPGEDELAATPQEHARALAQQATGALLAQAHQRAEEILAGANQKAVAMAEEACVKAAGRLENQLRSEIAALREQAVREAGEIVAKAQSDRQVMLASAQREIIALAIDIARRVVARELRVSPDVVLSVAAEALGHLPGGTETARILVNPADLEFIRAERDRLAKASSGLSSLETQSDAAVDRGGCVIQSPAGDIDGRLPTRFEQLEDALLRRNPSSQVTAAPTNGGGGWR